MYVTGRDIEEEGELVLRWDRELHGWMLVGEAEETRLTEQRRAILDALRQAGEPMGPKAIADATKISHGSVRNLLGKLAVDLRVESAGRGKWRLSEDLSLPAGEAGEPALSPEARGDDSSGDNENPHSNAENPPTVTDVTGVTGERDYGVSDAGGDSDDKPGESGLGKRDGAVTAAVTGSGGGDNYRRAEIHGRCKHDVQGGCWLCRGERSGEEGLVDG